MADRAVEFPMFPECVAYWCSECDRVFFVGLEFALAFPMDVVRCSECEEDWVVPLTEGGG